jgi:TfoX/Sxy family transcriptional regulator of competence genes
VRRILESEVKDALKRMKEGKAMGLDGISIELWRHNDTLAHWVVQPYLLMEQNAR